MTTLSRRLTGILLLAVAHTASAQYEPFALHGPQPGSREARVEFYGLGRFMTFDNMVVEGIYLPGVGTADGVLEVDDAWFGGFGMGYHINDHFFVAAEFAFSSPDYAGTWGTNRISGDMFLNSGSVNLDYHILPGPVTPFLSAGVGYLYLDTGIPSGPTEYWCWWDYWWGYTCTGVVPTHTEFELMLSAGGGLRADIGKGLSVRGQVRCTWVELGESGLQPSLEASVTVGVRF